MFQCIQYKLGEGETISFSVHSIIVCVCGGGGALCVSVYTV